MSDLLILRWENAKECDDKVDALKRQHILVWLTAAG